MIRPSLFALLFSLGCSNSQPLADASSDAPIDALQKDAASGCNDLMNVAPLVTVQHGPGGAAPTPEGGVLVPGTYFESSGTRYDGLMGAYGTGSQILRFNADGGYDQLTGDDSGISRYSGNWIAADASVLAVTQTCPKNFPAAYIGYTADPMQLHLYQNESAGVVFEGVFDKQ